MNLFTQFIGEAEISIIEQTLNNTGFGQATVGHVIMLFVGFFFCYLGIKKKFEPLLLVPIGFGIIIGNIPVPLEMIDGKFVGMRLSIYEENSVLNILYQGVRQGYYPPLIFLGIGAMTDFSTMLSKPKLILLGAAAQVGIFITFISALMLGFPINEAASIGIIGGADGPTAIFLTSMLAPELIGAIAVAAYSYMALVPVIQPPIMRLLTTRKERLIRMKDSRPVSKTEKIIFPIVGVILTCYVAPGAIPLLGMFFFGNLLKESMVTDRLAKTARTGFVDVITILLGLTVGASTQADVFLNSKSLLIFGLGAVSFMIATGSGVMFAKLMNVFSKEKINPLIGAAGVSAVPDSARVVQHVGREEDDTNHLLMHAMAPNVAGVIGSAIAAGVLYSILITG